MFKAIVKRAVPLLMLISILTGCWDSRDLEDRSIVDSALVDKTENGYAFYSAVAGINAGKQGNGGGSGQSGQAEFKMVHAQGKTIVEARTNLDKQLEQPIFLGAVQTVILSEKMAKSGIAEYLIRLRQRPDYRKTVDVVVTMEEPQKLMEFKPKNQISIGFAVKSLFKSLVDTGETFHITLAMILGIMATQNDCYVLHTIGIGSNLEMTGYSVFSKGKMMGFIPNEKGKGVVYFKTNDIRFEYELPYREGSVAVVIRNLEKNIKPKYKDAKVSFDVSFDLNAQLLYPQKGFKISESEKQQIIKNLQDMVLNELADAIRTSQQKFKCDYLNFYNSFRIAYPEEVKTMDWDKAYQKAEFRLKVSASLDLTSTIHYREED